MTAACQRPSYSTVRPSAKEVTGRTMSLEWGLEPCQDSVGSCWFSWLQMNGGHLCLDFVGVFGKPFLKRPCIFSGHEMESQTDFPSSSLQTTRTKSARAAIFKRVVLVLSGRQLKGTGRSARTKALQDFGGASLHGLVFPITR